MMISPRWGDDFIYTFGGKEDVAPTERGHDFVWGYCFTERLIDKQGCCPSTEVMLQRSIISLEKNDTTISQRSGGAQSIIKKLTKNLWRIFTTT